MLNKQQHDYYLKMILRDLVSDSELSSLLALKGGTCLYLFYGLPRFSVDLDFNLMRTTSLPTEKVNAILSKYLDIKNGRFRESENGWLWEASYQAGFSRFQIDINKRLYPDTYEVKQFYGLSIQTMTPDCLFAHKLCAIKDRKQFQNRDLFDSWFMFGKFFEINEEIIQISMKMSLSEYLKELIVYISKNVNEAKILDGLGKLLDDKQKSWVKDNLVKELLAQLQLKVESIA
jgi:predicted nucleotidyltransferase component of viral defense system